MDPRQLDRHVTGVAAAHQRLLAHLDAATDVDPARPSRLPGWSVGHVLTHLARNADSFVRLMAAAERGEVVDQYAGGVAEREADIEAGAPRPWEEQVADVRRTIWAVESAWAGHTRWDGRARTGGGEMEVSELPFRRWREVEVHHADLGIEGFDVDDWSDEYVREELRRMEMVWNARQPMGMTGLPEAALQADPHRRLAWLLGRTELADLPPAGVYP